MPVVMWGDTGAPETAKKIGFTGDLISTADHYFLWQNGKGAAMKPEAEAAMRRRLDDLLGLEYSAYTMLTPGYFLPRKEYGPALNRVDRNGKPIDNVDGLFPRAQEYCRDVGAATARSFGDMPALKGAMINTEVRDHTAPSFHEIDKQAYRREVGGEIPAQVTLPRGVHYNTVPNFPADRVIADNHPLLNYYRWFWKTGDAWNTLNSVTHDAFKQNLPAARRDEIFTWYDPAVRAPSIWGGGGKVDFVNQWTYSNPDPLKIGLAADELSALAEGHSGQQVMNMVQLFWYRSQTTDKPQPGVESEWEKKLPKASFITIAPDHLSEATWLNLAHPIKALAFHGWGSLGEEVGAVHHGYETTNAATRKRLQSLLTEVVKPLGPTLLQVPDAPTDVAFLESFASQIFAGRGTYGWGEGWGADSYLIARYAGLQPQIVYDETIRKNGLDKYKVLFVTHCDVLTQSVAEVIQKFQQRGGIVIGDEFLAPAIAPDILLTSLARTAPDATKKTMLEKAAALRGELDGYYRHAVESRNPEVLTRLRRFTKDNSGSDYVFAVNDNRTFGDYVGQYKHVMEKGVPSQSTISLRRKAGFVYDLMNKKQVTTTKTGQMLSFAVSLGAGEGNVFLVTDKAAGALQITLPDDAARGRSTPVTIQLSDSSGQPLSAVVPLEVSIRDPQKRLAEKSGFYGAKGGKLSLSLEIAPNDLPGQWHIEVREGLQGRKLTKGFTVK
jgi:hypothetical protein